MPPKSVVKFVESTRTMSPARRPDGGIQISALNSVLPAAVKGWGLLGSIALTTQHPHRVALRSGEFVVRQVGMEVERGDVVEQPRGVQVADRGQGCDLLGALDNGGTQPPGVVHRDLEGRHQGAGVLREPLLARHQRVAVVLVFDLTLGEIVGEAHVVMRGQ